MVPRGTPGAIILLAAVLALSLAWLPGALATPLSQPTVNVSMLDNRFDPPSPTISVGTTVVWTNNGSAPHTATSDSPLWDSGTETSGQTYSRSFDTPGTYPYHCIFHRGLGMVGTITVQAAQPTATATPVLPTATPTAAAPTATPTQAPATPTPTQAPATPTATPAPPTPTPTSTPTLAAPTATPAPAQPAPAAAPTLRILSPSEGQTVTGAELTIHVQVSNLTLASAAIGQTNQPGQGHWHLLLDGKLVQPVGTESFTLTGLTPGPHAIKVELHNNDHSPLSPPVEATVNITVAAQGVLPRTGEGNLSPWVLLLAGLAIVAGLSILVVARR